MRVGDRVRDCAGATCAPGVGDGVTQRPAGGRRLESAALVEQLHVEVQDPLADDVESKVPGFDHAGMNRPDGDLVGVVTGDRNGPGIERRAVIHQWPQRFVADEP